MNIFFWLVLAGYASAAPNTWAFSGYEGKDCEDRMRPPLVKQGRTANCFSTDDLRGNPKCIKLAVAAGFPDRYIELYRGLGDNYGKCTGEPFLYYRPGEYIDLEGYEGIGFKVRDV